MQLEMAYTKINHDVKQCVNFIFEYSRSASREEIIVVMKAHIDNPDNNIHVHDGAIL